MNFLEKPFLVISMFPYYYQRYYCKLLIFSRLKLDVLMIKSFDLLIKVLQKICVSGAGWLNH